MLTGIPVLPWSRLQTQLPGRSGRDGFPDEPRWHPDLETAAVQGVWETWETDLEFQWFASSAVSNKILPSNETVAVLLAQM